MSGRFLLAGLALMATLPASAQVPEPGLNWRRVATDGDRARVRNWRQTWIAALSEARVADGPAIVREPLLFAPDRALPGPIPPAGAYRCRTFKLGAKSAGMLGFVAYPAFDCRVGPGDDGIARFEKTGGSQRQKGRLYRDTATRAVFLGTLVLGDESRALAYGRDASRDLAGILERVGERRWRIALPEPRFESRFDVIEIVPAG